MMKTKGMAVSVLLVVVMAHLIIMTEPAQAFTCLDVAPNLAACISYLSGIDSRPPQICCDGVTRVKGMCVTTDNRRLACNCIKEVATRIRVIKESAVASLPIACNQPFPFPISTSFDCNSYAITFSLK
ncbi:hypothetical protein MKX01_005466 [Papaver californicum]|nr:hypothetical protein MKX01_005466 [Papaver californicum]